MTTIKDRIRLVQAERYLDDRDKTAEMLRLERKFGQPIQVLIATDRDSAEICKLLDITRSALCRWRKRLGIPVTRNSGRYVPTDERGRH